MHGQFSGFQVFIFTILLFWFFFIDLNSFSDVLSFNSLSILVHPPEPTKVAVSIPSPGANKSGSFNFIPWSQQKWQFQFRTLEPTKVAVSIPYLTVRMFRDSNLNSFLRGYRHSIEFKTSFMISGASFILTLNISISNFCNLR